MHIKVIQGVVQQVVKNCGNEAIVGSLISENRF